MLSYPAAYTHHIHLVRLSPLIDARKYATSRRNQNNILFHCNPFVKIAEVPFFGGVACLATPDSGAASAHERFMLSSGSGGHHCLISSHPLSLLLWEVNVDQAHQAQLSLRIPGARKYSKCSTHLTLTHSHLTQASMSILSTLKSFGHPAFL